MSKKIICVIPARLESTRLPRKILATIGGKTMLEQVFHAAKRCVQFDEILFAIDSTEAAEEIDRFGGRYLMTSKNHLNGTSRMIECMNRFQGDIWVNWQADEPFITPLMIDDLLQGIGGDGLIWTIKKEIYHEEEMKNPSVVKVVTDIHHKALYFSRSLIPFNRTGVSCKVFKHIGLYAYTKKALEQMATFRSELAEAESLEQLIFLENGLPIYVYPTQYESIGIDTPMDLAKANDFMILA